MQLRFTIRQAFLLGLFLCVYLLVLLICYIKIETVLTGYEIGQLKEKEALLLEQRATLRMQLAKLTTKSQLEKLAKLESVRGKSE